MIYLRSVILDTRPGPFPMNSPAISAAEGFDFPADVTILTGENGSGKSTFLEALARLLRLPAIGSSDTASDPMLAGVEPLTESMKPVFSHRQSRGFFLRAEDFFGYTKRISSMQDDMRRELARINEEYRDASAFTKAQARMAYVGSLAELNAAHGENPDAASHGESFMAMFEQRIRRGGLYLLDEPEAPLSPIRQLALIRLILERAKDSQFIIATHSPMLMAIPGAAIYSFDDAPAKRVEYGELENVRLLRDFLQEPKRYLQRLMD